MKLSKLILILFFLPIGQKLVAKNTTEQKIEEKRIKSRGGREANFGVKTESKPKKESPRKTYKKIKTIYKENQRKTPVDSRLEGLVLFPDKDSKLNKLGVHVGDELEIKISENMIGYGDSKRSVRGVVFSGTLESYIVLGNVSMDLKTKELKVDFDKIRDVNGNNFHKFKGEMRLKGRHESKFWTYFWASVGANAVGGFAEASKDREHTILGSKSVTSPSNIAKGALAEGAKAGSKVFLDEIKSYPEFTVVMGPTLATAVISEEPDILK